MTEDKPNFGDNVVSLSKTRAKRLQNAQEALVRQRAAELARQTGREADLSQKLANACALLEAIVRRHGPQVFGRQELEQECGSGKIAFDVTDARITLKLAE